jgi:antitoxin (DNA-binding transcriptional repressor) of toxin-antitoxin stability system
MLPFLLPKLAVEPERCYRRRPRPLPGVPLRNLDIAVHGELAAVLVPHHRRDFLRGEAHAGEERAVVVPEPVWGHSGRPTDRATGGGDDRNDLAGRRMANRRASTYRQQPRKSPARWSQRFSPPAPLATAFDGGRAGGSGQERVTPCSGPYAPRTARTSLCPTPRQRGRARNLEGTLRAEDDLAVVLGTRLGFGVLDAGHRITG